MPESNEKKKIVIIGAGPAGVTAALEAARRGDMLPIVLEETGEIGGISRTVNYKGNRIDIGGHRFFSKSETVMNWWLGLFPLQGKPSRDDKILGRNSTLSTLPGAPDPEKDDTVFLARHRVSRILFMRKLFDYPISLSGKLVRHLGLLRMAKLGASYFYSAAFPIKKEKSLEDFFINRFGRELYELFFKDYTEKVWGVPCAAIKPEWGAQRVKGLSVTKALADAFKSAIGANGAANGKNTETTLIKQFYYPKFGPGQLWERAAAKAMEAGAQIHLNHTVEGLDLRNGILTGVRARNTKTGEISTFTGDCYISTMPVRDLVMGMGGEVPQDVRKAADALRYRDFMTVGLLVDRLAIKNETNIPSINGIAPDNWIYIQERDVKAGRMQIFNNWSPYMVADPSKVWIGLEYFCQEKGFLWNMPDEEFINFAVAEMEKIGVLERSHVFDGVVIRVPKAYPAYFGGYEDFGIIRNFLDGIPNLYLAGRNGMHRYNNMDHSMLSAMAAIGNIAKGYAGKENIWNVNAEDDYHESA